MSSKINFSKTALVAVLAGGALALGGPTAMAQTSSPSASQATSAQQGAPAGSGAAASAAATASGPEKSDMAQSKAGSGSTNAALSPDTTSEQFLTAQKSSQTLATSIIGVSVKDGAGKDAKEIGKVTDLILNQDHKLVGVVVGVGGFLGIGQKDVGIPWNRVSDINPESKVVRVKMTKKELEDAPAFTSTKEQKEQKDQQAAKQHAQGAMAAPQQPLPAGSAGQPAGVAPKQ